MVLLKHARILAPLVVLAALFVAACGGDAPTAAPPPPTLTATAVGRSQFPPVPVTTPPATAISLPADDAAHAYSTEWWYYTGHLASGNGPEYGFEFVIFQVRPIPGGPPIYISHFAVTDPDPTKPFLYDARSSLGPQRTASRGVALDVGGWKLTAFDGRDTVVAETPGVAIDLRLTSTKPPALHTADGLLEFPGSGWTYYYTRTRLEVEGTLRVGEVSLAVTGAAWFDHQWGDFDPTYGKGGWDWLSVQLDDDAELMVVVLKDQAGSRIGAFGTYVDEHGRAADLDASSLTVEPAGEWTSPATGIKYPAGWKLGVQALDLVLTITPMRPDQELDVRSSTGNIYWEGATRITGTRGGMPVTGRGYTELTGYDQRK